MRSRLNFNHLECFLVIARTLSFSKAAHELKIAQPAVSKQIRALEDQLGVQLFLRNKKSVALTEAGKQLFDKTSSLYQAICEEAEELNSSVGIKGNIRFGCLTEVGERIFVDPLAKFKESYPQVRIQIHLLKAHEIIEKIKADELDVGIIPDMILQENIKSYEIYREEIILATNKQNHKKHITKVTELPFIAYRENDPLLNLFIKKISPRANQSKLDVQITVNSHKAMAKLLLTQPFYAVLPKLSVMQELEEKKLFQVGNKSIHAKLYLVMRDSGFTDKKVELFRQHLMKYTKEHL